MQGGAKGTDALAKDWAMTKADLKCFEYRADWKRHGNAAGPIRNQRMLEWAPIWSWRSQAARERPAWLRCRRAGHRAVKHCGRMSGVE